MSEFKPKFVITPRIATALMRIESAREAVSHLPITPSVLASLRESARLFSTHYSTMIEGNRLTQEQVTQVIGKQEHFPGRERDEKEVLGYYAALARAEQLAAGATIVTEQHVQTLHALVMAGGGSKVKHSVYRDGQNVIRDSRSKGIVYMPPEAKDVPGLMHDMVVWIKDSEVLELPCPIRAGIAHYQFATIHPYYDGNGRTARVLTTWILHLGDYDLKGLYSLEEYYARNLGAYYEAISVGESHNYYMGRAESDITKWVEYFVDGRAVAFENVLKCMNEAQYSPDQSTMIRKLDPKQRKALELFQDFETITSRQIGELFGFKPRTSAALCANWIENGFIILNDSSNKGRNYKLSA